MHSQILIGDVPVPLIIEDDDNVAPVGSSSGASLGQGSSSSSKDSEITPLDLIPNPSDSETEDDEIEAKSGTDQNQDDNNPGGHHGAAKRNGRKRKRYHRHTAHQIREMEAFFKDCPHPDDKQRKELGRDLGLGPLQVKFWFQNKRTQVKAQSERTENIKLKTQNDKLRAENVRFKDALTRACCSSCGSKMALSHATLAENQLRQENARLLQEVENLAGLTHKFVNRPITIAEYDIPNTPVIPSPLEDLDIGDFVGEEQLDIQGDVINEEELIRSLSEPTEINKPRIIELATAAMDELIQMAEVDYPLWLPCTDHRNYVLNDDVYFDMFPEEMIDKPEGFKVEASRDIDIVMMNQMNILEILMNLHKFLAMFASIVSRGLVLEFITTGPNSGCFNGSLQVLTTEYQVLTPTVPTRESIFVRYCKQISEDKWGVVDVSFENLHGSGSLAKCHKKPSGCIIQAIPNGSSKVTWIEHVEVEDRGVHYLGKPFVDSGLAFGAQRWVAILSRQCERIATAAATNFRPDDINNTGTEIFAQVLTNPQSRKNILKLAERMVLSFCGGVTSSTAYSWLKQSGVGSDEVRIMTKVNENDPGKPSGIVLSASTSFWVPVSHKTVFEFLRDESSRKEWDILSRTGDIQELMHISNGHEVGNCVSMLRVSGTNSSPGMLIVQECSTDTTASCVIYAPVDPPAMKTLLAGGSPDHVELLPSGFTIYPSARPTQTITNGDQNIVGLGVIGSLVTVAFQILVDPTPNATCSGSSVAVINSLIDCTTQRIKNALASNPNPNPNPNPA